MKPILAKILNSTIADLNRTVSLNVWGAHDPRQAFDCLPHGIDSCPVKGAMGVYVNTSADGDSAMLGVRNTHAKAQPGELRVYATDGEGAEVFYGWLKNDGTLELGGNTKHMVRYEDLNVGLQAEKTLINTNLTAIAAVLNGAFGPGTYTPTTVTVDISAAKINEIKTL